MKGKKIKNRITSMFGIDYPIIQAGMIWCSGWKLASAVSNAGALGLIGSGSMYPDILKTHIRKCKKATSKPFGVNLPLMYPQINDHINIILEEKIPIVFTSAGNPAKWTAVFKEAGIKVVHVVSSVKFAVKSELAGVDAVVAEGFEAGGHNGREETSTICLVPAVADSIDIPVIAAGGIANGKAMLAAFALGAEAVQIGSRFVASEESSAHINFKKKILETKEGQTKLSLKQLAPVRLIKNKFYQMISEAEEKGASPEELAMLLGKGRAKNGMFLGNLEEGELEIGQVSGQINEILPAVKIIENLWKSFKTAHDQLSKKLF